MKPSVIWGILNVPTQEELLRKFSSKESLSLDVALRLNPEVKNTTRVVIQEIVPISVAGSTEDWKIITTNGYEIYMNTSKQKGYMRKNS